MKKPMWCLVAALSVSSAVCADGKRDLDKANLVLAVTAPETNVLGTDITLTVALSAKNTQTVISVPSADLSLTVTNQSSGEKLTSYRGRYRREFSIGPTTGLVIEDDYTVKKQEIVLLAGESSAVTVSMFGGFYARLETGTYTVTVVYEDQLTAKATFAVAADREKTVPVLIDLIASRNVGSRMWARKQLFALAGVPKWKPEMTDTQARVDEEVKALRLWWEQNAAGFQFLAPVADPKSGTKKPEN